MYYDSFRVIPHVFSTNIDGCKGNNNFDFVNINNNEDINRLVLLNSYHYQTTVNLMDYVFH
ncbi:hypothetical protein ACM17_25660 (plasmid) [Escherichia coli]|nr:hypothetical protein VK74_24515 [Escherichia coli]EFN7364555.1 hypothetical protein [Escherichia coli O180:H14]APK96832.1 hypothetical protein RG54_24895 [Escherichia coli]APL01691.1 hypothetical protein RG55_24875 [Escherichia coli]APL11393.1 hypothetical protein RG57_23990 [Escherichia coli]